MSLTHVTQLSAAGRGVAAAPHRLLVTHKLGGMYRSIGFLTGAPSGPYRFEYLRAAVDSGQFRPLPGLPATPGGATSDTLFPFFSERVISASRPDREETLEHLALEATAGPFEILGRTGGLRVTDSIEVIPLPQCDEAGWLHLPFFVHGVRHLDETELLALEALTPGQALSVEREPHNPKSEQALMVLDSHTKLGYVPHPLIDFVREASRIEGFKLTVRKVNSEDVGFHQRLLVQLSVPDRRQADCFSGAQWVTL